MKKLKQLLREELTKTEINKIIDDKVKSKIEQEVKKQLKDTKTQKEIKEIAAKVVENFIDTLFIRKMFYKTQLRK